MSNLTGIKIISEKDFHLLRVLLSERYHELRDKVNNGKAADVNMEAYRVISELYNKYK